MTPTMMMIFLVFGTVGLFARFISRKLPKGARFFVLASLISVIFSFVAGFAYAMLFAGLTVGNMPNAMGYYLLKGFTFGFEAAVMSVVAVWFYRKKPPTPVNAKLHDRYAGLYKPDYRSEP